MDLKQKIREIPDFPQQGVSFKDITTLLKDGAAYQYAIDRMADYMATLEADLIIGPEARGFVTGSPLAYKLGLGFVPVRKKGKLPAATVQASYDLEYGQDVLAIHADAVRPGQNVVIVDDLLATGGTTKTTIQLVEQLGGQVSGCLFLIELAFLKGRDLIGHDYVVHSLVKYDH